jgi:hypothetical protein
MKQVLTELFFLHEGTVTSVPGLLMFIPGGVLPVPQTDPLILAYNMISPRADWRKILANEILLYLMQAFNNDHPEAVRDALDWCTKYRLSVQDWIRDAPRTVNRLGKRSVETQRELFRTDFQRYIEVEIAAIRIAAERKKGGSRRDPGLRDKFARAKERLQYSWADIPTEDTGAIKDSYKRFKRFRHTYYLDSVLLMDLLKVHAPAVFEILS